MDRRSARASFVFLALAAAAWWSLGREHRRQPTRVEPAAGASADGACSSAQAPVAAPASPPESPPDGATRTARVEAREPSTPLVASETLAVLVVERGTGKPIAGAEVRAADDESLGQTYSWWRPRRNADVEIQLAAAPRAVTDDAGIARVAADVVPGVVSARLGPAYGELRVHDANAQPIRLELARDVAFSIQVVDVRGQPVAGVPVAIRSVNTQAVSANLWDGITEGPDGIARVAHAQLFVRRPDALPVFACIDALLRERVTSPVDFEHPPAAPVVLVLPPWGSLEARVHESDGALVLPQGLNLADQSQVDADGYLDWSARTYAPTFVEAGRAVFDFIGLGQDLYADALDAGRSAKWTGPGPRAQGEVVEIDLDLGPPRPTLVGRLVDERGAPIADARVQGAVEFQGGGASGSSSAPLRTDRDGRFVIRLPAEGSDKLTGTLVLRPFGRGHEAEGEADAVLDGRVHAGENDLGTLVARPPKSIASGRLVDDAGEPIANALFSVETLKSERGAESWLRDARLRGQSLADGTFEIRGPLASERLRLSVAHSAHVEADPVEIAPGIRGMTIVLTRASRIEGRVLLDEGAQSARIWASARRPEDSVETARRFAPRERAAVGVDGVFRIANVRPGRVDVVVHLQGSREPLATLVQVELRPGEAASDARLDAIDLRGRVPPAETPSGGKR